MLNATLVRKQVVHDDLLILGVKPDAGVPSFLPGQYVALGLPADALRASSLPEREPQQGDKLIKRAYSVGSSPHEREALEFYLAQVPDGSLTPRLAALPEGARLFCAPKIIGTFTLEGVPADHNLVLVATGTGLAPFISMLRTPDTWSAGRRITIVHGVRHAKDLAYDAELKRFAAERGQFRYIPIVSREEPGWTGERGRVPTLFESGAITLDPTRDHVFLCGNPGMIEQLEGSLGGRGYTVHSKKASGNLHVEKYW